MKKRVLSAFMALALCLTLLPAAAWAEEADADGGAIVQEQQEEQQEEVPAAEPPAISEQAAGNGIAVQATGDAVAEVTIGTTTTEYTDINAAFTAAQDSEGGTVTLLKDVTTEKQIVVSSGTFTLDLNGKILDRSTGNTLRVNSGGNVTVTSSQGTGTISNGENNAIYVDANATVHVEKGVKLSRLYAVKGATLTLDVSVIITGTLSTNADNIATFLTGKALQAYDADNNTEKNTYVSIYKNYDTNSGESTGCVIVIEHKSCEGTPSKDKPCTICGYDGTQTKPTEPADLNVAEINGTKYRTLAEAVKAANGADIKLLKIFGENVVVEDGAKAGIILGNGGTVEGEGTYPSYWMADSNGIPLTMNAGEITLKSGVLSQGKVGADNNIAIKLNGGTLTVADTVTKIIGGSVDSTAQNTAQMAAIEATGGTLDLQGNTLLDGGLSISGNAQLAHKLKAGIFTNSGSTTASVSVEASNHYGTVFDLLETGYAFAKYDKDADKAGDVIAKNDSKSLKEDVTVIKCTHKGANGTSLFEDDTCTGCGLTCTHEKIDETGKCTACGTQMAAQDDAGKYYADLEEAFDGVMNNGTVRMLADVSGQTSFYYDEEGDLADKTVTLSMNSHSLSYENAPALQVESGKLIIGDDATITQTNPRDDEFTSPAVNVYGGTLEFKTKATITGGLSVSYVTNGGTDGETRTDGTLTGGLKVGTIITSNGKYSVLTDSANHTNAASLLPDGCAFAKYENGKDGDIVNGYVDKLTEDVIVVAHTHNMGENNTCACGFTCSKHHFENGVCTICGYACPHPSNSVVNSFSGIRCKVCSETMVVKVENGDTTTYYAEHHENTESAAEDTLKQVFMNAESGSTVTLLADGLYASGWAEGKELTLNLNGKNVIENNGFVVESKNGTAGKLIVTGSGSSETPGSYSCTFRVWNGELLFDDNFSGSYGTIYVHGGTLTSDSTNSEAIHIDMLNITNSGATISLKGGTFDKITCSGSKTLGDLLADGYCFEQGGTPLKSDTTITSIENVTVVQCKHASITNDGTCDYCGMDNIAAVLTKPDGSIQTYTIGSGNDIFTGLTNNGGTLKLYSDLTWSYYLGTQNDTTTKMVIDLNGHTITPSSEGAAVGVQGGTLTIMDSSNPKTGKFASTLNIDAGAELIVDGAAVGKIIANDKTAKITLKAGTTFTGYSKPSGMMLAQWIEDGNCISGLSSIDAYTDKSESGSFAVKKVPATFSTPVKSGTIRYNGLMPEKVIPGITLDAGSNVSSVEMRWYYYSKDGSFNMMNQNGTIYPNAPEKTWRGYVNSDVFNKFNIGETISDVLCVLTASDGSWSTVLRGYSFTLASGDLSEATVNATDLDSLVYTVNGDGDSVSQQLQFTVKSNDWTTLTEGTDYQVKDNSNTAYTAGEHTLVLEGLGKYAGSTLTYKWTVKPRVLTGIADLSKSYDGTTALPNITFAYDGGTVTLTEGKDYTVTGRFDSADAGDKTVSVTVTLKNTNYTFADGKTEQTFTVNTRIDKAAVSGLKNVSQTIRCVAGVEQSFMPELTSFGIPAGAQIQDIPGVTCSDGAPVTSYGSEAPGKIHCTLGEGAKVGDTFSISFIIELTNYQDAYVTINVKLTDRDTPDVTANAITVTYDGSAVSVDKITGSATFNGEMVEGTWSWKDGQALTNVSDSGEKTVIFTPKDAVNYKPVEAKVRLTVNPAALTNVSVQQSGALTYNGQPQTPTVDAKATAVNGQQVTFTYCDTQNGTYGNMPQFTDAGEHTVYYKAAAANHETATGSFKVTIAKADPICTAPTGVTAIYGQKLSEIALTNPSGNTEGTWTWTDDTQSVGDVGDHTFKASFTPKDAQNYNGKSEIDVTVKVNKAGSTVSAAPTANTLTYTGGEQALVNAGATADGTMVYSLSENGTYSETIPTGTNADTYTVWYKVAGDSNHNDSTAESVSVTIAKAQVTVTVKDKSAYVGSAAPDLSKPELDKDYTVSGLIGDDTLTTAPTLKYVDETGKEIKPDMTKVGEVLIRADGEQSDNYVIVYVAGTLTVTARPSSPSSSTTTKAETTTNPDGSVTKTETKSDGTVIETTTNKDGSTTKTETKPDGSSKTEVKDASGSTGTVKTDKDGQTTAEAKISDKALSDAKKSDEAVKVPAEVTPGEDSASAPTVKIDLPKDSGEAKIEIPVKDATSGTVAIIVKPDGTEEIVKDSVPTEDGIQLTVDGDVTVKIVNNAKDFADTKGHWAQDSIDFVSARGLVNGTGESTFAPNAPTTRAQLWTILARQAGADLTGGASWYEKAQAWAKESGISDGSDPNGTITRAQMVTMLYRAAGSPEVDAASTFADVSADSYYAKAVAWAVQHGITTGVGSGKFDPNGACTRAQIATFLHRSYLSK